MDDIHRGGPLHRSIDRSILIYLGLPTDGLNGPLVVGGSEDSGELADAVSSYRAQGTFRSARRRLAKTRLVRLSLTMPIFATHSRGDLARHAAR
jgi:hypothetical protein